MIALLLTLLACGDKGDDSASDTAAVAEDSAVEEQDSAEEEDSADEQPEDTAEESGEE